VLLKLFLLVRTQLLHIEIISNKFTHCSPLCFKREGNVKCL
jgi:hypothetical protein